MDGKKEGQVITDRLVEGWGGEESACAQGATPALPEPPGLGEFPRQVLALRDPGKGRLGTKQPARRPGRLACGRSPCGSRTKARGPLGSSLGPTPGENRSPGPSPLSRSGAHFGSLDSKAPAPHTHTPTPQAWSPSMLPLPLRNSTEAASFLLLRKKHFVLASSPLRDWGSLFPGPGSGPHRGLVSASPSHRAGALSAGSAVVDLEFPDLPESSPSPRPGGP